MKILQGHVGEVFLRTAIPTKAPTAMTSPVTAITKYATEVPVLVPRTLPCRALNPKSANPRMNVAHRTRSRFLPNQEVSSTPFGTQKPRSRIPLHGDPG